MPPWESIYIDQLDLDYGERDLYWELQEKVWESRRLQSETYHRFLGHPDQEQNDMQQECALVSNGLYCGDSTGWNDPRAADLLKEAPRWQLLLQIHSDDRLGTMFGDVGKIYYWIREDDLEKHDFDRVWLVLQCG